MLDSHCEVRYIISNKKAYFLEIKILLMEFLEYKLLLNIKH